MLKRSWSQVDADRGPASPASRRLSATSATTAATIITFNARDVQSDARLEALATTATNATAEKHALPLNSHTHVSESAAPPAGPQDRGTQTQTPGASWPAITRKVKACAACRKQKVGRDDMFLICDAVSMSCVY